MNRVIIENETVVKRKQRKGISMSAMKIMKFAVAFFIFPLFIASAVHADEAGQDVEKRLESFLPAQSKWALVVVDMKTGNPIAEYGNSLQSRLVPASLTKLLTTGAVLEYAENDSGNVKMVTRGVRVIRKKKKRIRRTFQRVVTISGDEQLSRVLRDMNVHSRNTVAQNLADFLGERRYGPPATQGKGARAVVHFLNTFDLPLGEAVIADGCGLRRDNRVTARFMALYLYQIGKKPWFDRFRETLPRPGLEGTVRRIGYTNPGFRVKTGHLDDVFALAGYGADQSGKDFSFAFIVNVKKGNASDRKHSRGELLRLLADGEIQRDNAGGL